MCEFQSLYYESDGYVVRCKQCGLYQVAFISTLLTLSAEDLEGLRRLVRTKAQETERCVDERAKTVIIHTPFHGICLLLTPCEANQFSKILEHADNEEKALSMMDLFSQ